MSKYSRLPPCVSTHALAFGYIILLSSKLPFCTCTLIVTNVDSFQAPLVIPGNQPTDKHKLALLYLPMGIVGLTCCFAGEPMLHAMPPTLLLFLVSLAWVAAPLILAAVPTPINYVSRTQAWHRTVARPNHIHSQWSTIFPSMLCVTAGINLTFNISITFLSEIQKPEYQGLCGAICSILLGLAFAFSLPIAQIVMTRVSGSDWTMYDLALLGPLSHDVMLLGYRSAFIYATVSAGVGMVLCTLLVRISIPGRTTE